MDAGAVGKANANRYNTCILRAGGAVQPQEVLRLLAAIRNLKHRAILCMTYSSGLRIGEAVRLKIADFDREGVAFQKAKLAFGYMGYSFKTTIYNNKGKSIKEIVINSEDTISYNTVFTHRVIRPRDYKSRYKKWGQVMNTIKNKTIIGLIAVFMIFARWCLRFSGARAERYTKGMQT